MKKFFAAFATMLVCCVFALCAGCKDGKGQKKPEKIKDGTALTITAGESKNIDLTEYITIEGTKYSYSAESSDDGVATVSVDGNVATVTAVAEGSAEVTASADAVQVKFAVTVNKKTEQQPQEKPAPVFDDVSIEYDLKDGASKDVTLSPKSGSSTFKYTYALKAADPKVTVSGAKITVAYDEACEKQLTVVASYTDSENASAGTKTVDFKLNVKVTDTRTPADPTAKYKVKNGGFDSDLQGWTSDGDIGAISEQDTFWPDRDGGFPVFNVGKYFAGDDAKTGKLKSSLFEVGGANKITFMLGAAGNKDCYITLENAEGKTLALWRNVKFEDVGGNNWNKDQIGKTQFANNLVTYVADLEDYAGQSVRVVLNDNATENFGFINFDELVTYYATAGEVPAGATAAVNELADKAALKTAVDGAITERGDYTEASFTAYTAKVAAAQAALDKLGATQNEVDTALSELQTAKEALTPRLPVAKTNADTNVALLVNGNKEITISDYVDENNLTSITYTASAVDQKLTVGNISQGKFTVSASEEVETTVTITVLYKGNPTGVTVALTVKVTDGTPSVKVAAKVTDIDLYTETNTTGITLDFAENLNNPAGLTFSYTVTKNGSPVTLDGSSYTLTYGEYTETATAVVFDVQVAYTLNETPATLSYTHTLNIKDTRAYRIVNGDFDHGTEANGYLDGWTLSNADLGKVNADANYWKENIPFNNEGKFFNAYSFGENENVAIESATGTLKSSEFKVSKSGWITYKLGGAKNIETVTFEVVSADGTKRAVLPNFDWSDYADSKTVRGCTLVAYKANLQSYGFAEGDSVYILVTDNGTSEYGLFFLDSVETYYTQEPTDDFNLVAPTRLLNGGFEHGNLTGWTLERRDGSDGDIGRVCKDNKYFDNVVYGKDGDYLFTGICGFAGKPEQDGQPAIPGDPDPTPDGFEKNKGTLRSSNFLLKAGVWISFKLGGATNDKTLVKVYKADGTLLAQFKNSQPDTKTGKLVQYVYQFTEVTEDTMCYIVIDDDAKDGWGVMAVDSIITHYESAPNLTDQKTAVKFVENV